jgi:hypothetical protein
MPLVQRLLLCVPVIPLGAIMVFFLVALSIGGLSIVWRFVPRQMLKAHNDLTAAIFEAIAMAYTVLLAFVVVISWQNFDRAEEHTVKEANCLVGLYSDSAAFVQPFQNDLRSLIKEYVNVVISEEWTALGRGEESVKAIDALRDLWGLYTSYEPKTKKEELFLAESIHKLDDLRDMRRLRIIDSRTGVHPVLWFVLLVGAITTISFTFFFGSDKFLTHAIMASVLSMIIALILLTIVSFDFPFTGSVRIGPETFQEGIGRY